MKLGLLLTLLPLFAYAQQGPIKIVLKNNEVVYTNYAHLNNNGTFTGPYVRIHHKRGEKVPIDIVDHVEGIDQRGTYKYFKPINFGYRGEVFAERTFTSKRIKIYYTNVVSGTWNATYSFRHFNYEKDGALLKKMTYANLKKDLSDCPTSTDFLKKANGYRIAQMALYGAGAALVIHGIATGLSGNDDELPPPGAAPRIKIPATFVIGAISLMILRFLNNPKQGYFVDALKNYQ